MRWAATVASLAELHKPASLDTSVRLKLQPVGGSTGAGSARDMVVITSTNATEFSASFAVTDPALTIGTEWVVSIAAAHTNGVFHPIAWFQSKTSPATSRWAIVEDPIAEAEATMTTEAVIVTRPRDGRPRRAAQAAPGLVRVAVDTAGIGLDYVGGIPRNATDAIDAALLECRTATRATQGTHS